MRAWAGALAGLAVALVVPGATASPSAPVRSLAPPSIGGTWTGDGFAAGDTLTLSSDGTKVNGGSTKSWVCDQGGWRAYKEGETVAAWKGPFRDLIVGSWTGDRTFKASYRHCYTGVFNPNLNSVQPPFSQYGDLLGTVSANANTITYTYKVSVPCNATDFSYCALNGSGTLTRVAEKKPQANLAIELYPPVPRKLADDGTPGTPGRLRMEVGNGGPDEARNVVVTVRFHFGMGKPGKAQRDIAPSSLLTTDWRVSPDEDCTVTDEDDVRVRCTFDTLAAKKHRKREIYWTFGGTSVMDVNAAKNRWRLLIADIKSHPKGWTYLCASGEVYSDTKDPEPDDNHDPESWPPCKRETALRIQLSAGSD